MFHDGTAKEISLFSKKKKGIKGRIATDLEVKFSIPTIKDR